jgi:hypothetical protein
MEGKIWRERGEGSNHGVILVVCLCMCVCVCVHGEAHEYTVHDKHLSTFMYVHYSDLCTYSYADTEKEICMVVYACHARVYVLYISYIYIYTHTHTVPKDE